MHSPYQQLRKPVKIDIHPGALSLDVKSKWIKPASNAVNVPEDVLQVLDEEIEKRHAGGPRVCFVVVVRERGTCSCCLQDKEIKCIHFLFTYLGRGNFMDTRTTTKERVYQEFMGIWVGYVQHYARSVLWSRNWSCCTLLSNCTYLST